MKTTRTKSIERPVDRRSLPARAALERTGLDQILARIRAGESQREIADSLQVDVSTLNRFLRSNAERAEATRAAMTESAEAWLDRGLRELEQAKGQDNAEMTRVRAVAMECARRAAIRNPRYSDKQQVELSGPDGGPMQ